MRLATPSKLYDVRDEAETRRALEQEIERQAAQIRDLIRRLAAAGIP